MPSGTSFSESQRFTQIWIWLLVLAVVAMGWWAFIEQIIYGHAFWYQSRAGRITMGDLRLVRPCVPVFFWSAQTGDRTAR